MDITAFSSERGDQIEIPAVHAVESSLGLELF